eukprot:g7457.t1
MGDDQRIGTMANFVISALGPAFAVVATNPFDVVKCRLQMQNELRRGKGPYRGPIDCFWKTLANEGIPGIQRGLPVCVLRDFTKGFWRIGLYQPLIDFVHGDDTKKRRPGLLLRVAVGALCGFVSSAVSNPLDLLKVRIQSSGGLGDVHYKADSGYQTFRSIMDKEGLKGLYRGTVINMIRSSVSAAVLLPTVTKSKEILADEFQMEEGLRRDAIASLIGSVFCAYSINPMDVTRTRLYNQPVNSLTGRGSLYHSIPDALSKIVRNEGPLALYKGVVAHYFRVGPYIVLSFVFIGLLRRQWLKQQQSSTLASS